MMRLSQAAEILDTRFIGQDVLFNGISKDTRTLHEGDLYVAIKGDNFDGNNFVAQAASAGAAAALVSSMQALELPQLEVKDTRLALGQLAAGWRQQYAGQVIGITGSNGKTTVKEMCRSILLAHAGEDAVLSTQGNLNNDIGMPLTVLSLRAQHQFAVIEMGANHVGEIEYLTQIAQPHVALVNNVGPAHIEGFGSLDNIAQAKAEIYSGLVEQGVAVINLDDVYASTWLALCKQKNRRSFALKNVAADVYASDMQLAAGSSRFVLHVDGSTADIHLPLPGQHNVMNALAASCVCSALDVKIETIAQALQAFSGVSGRLKLRAAINGASLIDDTYNANPQSFAAAMQVLVTMPGKPWMVMADMGELGANAAGLHHELGAQAKALGIEQLFAMGELSREAVAGFGANAHWFKDHASLLAAVRTQLSADVVVLIKGSRFMKMEVIVAGLLSAIDAKTENNNNNSSGNHREAN